MWDKYTTFWDMQGIEKSWYRGFTNMQIVVAQA